MAERAAADKPFFLYLAYNAPHGPVQPPEAWLKKVVEREPQASPLRQKLIALIEHMDDGIGRVLATLDRLKLAEDTIVVYTSDNGGLLAEGANNGPWRSGKTHMFEGGLRVPAAMRWPKRVAAGSKTDRIALTMDLFATCCEAAGTTVPKQCEAESFLPTLLGDAQKLSLRVFTSAEEGIVCILGTGSNSCVYDGQSVTKSIPTLGYIFSDEGGGTNFGKEILKAYFYETMPEKERAIFIQNFTVTKEVLIEKVYRSSGGNRYVASFAQFLVLIDGTWKTDLIKKLFREFVELRILSYPDHKTHKIKFVGSIAHYHRTYLEEVLEEYYLKADEIIQQPIYKLIDFHLKNSINE